MGNIPVPKTEVDESSLRHLNCAYGEVMAGYCYREGNTRRYVQRWDSSGREAIAQHREIEKG